MSKPVKDNNVEVSLRQPYEAQLNKYTNMVKGWQHRWFVLDPSTGMLEYYMSESEKKLKPRGSLYLAGALVVPSEEDSFSFAVNAANGESYKLRAADARDRQFWINRLRVVAQAHTSVIAETNPPLAARDHRSLSVTPSLVSLPSTTASVAGNNPNQTTARPSDKILTCNLTVLDAFSSVNDCLKRVDANHLQLVSSIEGLATTGNVTSLDSDLLLLKATSQATLLCLEQCLAILDYQQQQAANKPQLRRQTMSGGNSPKPSKISSVKESRFRADSATSAISNDSSRAATVATVNDAIPKDGSWAQPPEPEPEVTLEMKLEDEVSEEEDNREIVAPSPDDAKTLPVLSQLKLGTELTRTTLPVFLCETRSLLQLLADAFRKPETLLKIGEGTSPEQRMAHVVEWYLSCIEACGLKIAPAKKPFNPILGEIFKCSWNIHSGDKLPTLIQFWAEQVSHHPPVSAFHLDCPERNVRISGNVAVKAKFMGMNVVASLSGEVILHLTDSDEKYEAGFPSLYVRSILAEPWVELGGKVTIHCQKTALTSNIIFHTKPFYGGKAHHVTAEVKTANGSAVCKLSGDWTTALELTWNNGTVETIDLKSKAAYRKRLRPISSQWDKESQKVWRSVATALSEGDTRTAAEHKRFVEDRERGELRELAEQGLAFKPHFFESVGESWMFKK